MCKTVQRFFFRADAERIVTARHCAAPLRARLGTLSVAEDHREGNGRGSPDIALKCELRRFLNSPEGRLGMASTCRYEI